MAKKKRTNAVATKTPAQEVPALSAEEQAARREQQKREWAERKRREEREERGVNPVLWISLGGAAIAAIVAIVIVVLVSGGGSDSSASSNPTNTPDARVDGLTPQKTVNITARDSGQEVNVSYDTSTLSGVAGQVIEIDVKNAGTVHHNVQIAGLDGQFDTSDDWYTDPYGVDPGQTGKLIVKIDKPGNYQFHCSFHPTEQVGTLVLS